MSVKINFRPDFSAVSHPHDRYDPQRPAGTWNVSKTKCLRSLRNEAKIPSRGLNISISTNGSWAVADHSFPCIDMTRWATSTKRRNWFEKIKP